MLDEARRRVGRGTDVIVAAYRVHRVPGAPSKLDLSSGLREAKAVEAADQAVIEDELLE